MNIFLTCPLKVTSYNERDLSHSGGNFTPQDHVWMGNNVHGAVLRMQFNMVVRRVTMEMVVHVRGRGPRSRSRRLTDRRDAIFPDIHTTWQEPFRDSLYGLKLGECTQ